MDDLLEAIRTIDPEVELSANKAIFRIQRDMRFAKGLPPYKVHRSALISDYGKKSIEGARLLP